MRSGKAQRQLLLSFVTHPAHPKAISGLRRGSSRGEVARVCGVRVLCDIESLHLPSSRSGATEKARPFGG